MPSVLLLRMKNRKDITDEEFAAWEDTVIRLEVYCTLKGWTEISYNGLRRCQIVGEEFHKLLAKHHRLFGLSSSVVDTSKSCYSLLRDLNPIVFNSLANELIERPRLNRENSNRFVEVLGKRLQSLEPELQATAGSTGSYQRPRHAPIRRARPRTT